MSLSVISSIAFESLKPIIAISISVVYRPILHLRLILGLHLHLHLHLHLRLVVRQIATPARAVRIRPGAQLGLLHLGSEVQHVRIVRHVTNAGRLLHLSVEWRPLVVWDKSMPRLTHLLSCWSSMIVHPEWR